MTTPSSVAIPKSARKPTHTATLRLRGEIWNTSRIDLPKISKSSVPACV